MPEAESVKAEQLVPVLAELARALNALRADGGSAPEGLDPSAAAAFVGVSVSKWHAMNAAGHCPAPVELGDRCPRWLRGELRAWLYAGAPTRVTWLQIRRDALRRTA